MSNMAELTGRINALAGELETLRAAGVDVPNIVSLPEGWHAVPEHATDKMIVAASKGSSTADKFRRMIYAAPKLA